MTEKDDEQVEVDAELPIKGATTQHTLDLVERIKQRRET